MTLAQRHAAGDSQEGAGDVLFLPSRLHAQLNLADYFDGPAGHLAGLVLIDHL
jgi:hypothetical protein